MSSQLTNQERRLVDQALRACREATALVLHLAIPGELEEVDTGGYFSLQAKSSRELLIDAAEMATVTSPEAEDFMGFSREKAKRLLEQHAKAGHVSSFQSRDDKRHKYPGAVMARDRKARGYVYSFSGLPWKYDEAICLTTAIKMGHLSLKEAAAIAKISDNEIFARVADHLDTDQVFDNGSRLFAGAGALVLLILALCATFHIG